MNNGKYIKYEYIVAKDEMPIDRASFSFQPLENALRLNPAKKSHCWRVWNEAIAVFLGTLNEDIGIQES